MSESGAVIGCKVMVNLLPSRKQTRTASIKEDLLETSARKSAAPAAAERWAGRTMWLLVTAIGLWDIAATFDQHFALTGRLFSAALMR